MSAIINSSSLQPFVVYRRPLICKDILCKTPGNEGKIFDQITSQKKYKTLAGRLVCVAERRAILWLCKRGLMSYQPALVVCARYKKWDSRKTGDILNI